MTTNIKSLSLNGCVLRQVCNHIRAHALGKIARKHGAEDLARSFDYWSHLVFLVFSKLSHNFGLNDLCDQAEFHSGVSVR